MSEEKIALAENAATGRKWFKPEHLPHSISTQAFSFYEPSRVQYHNGVTLFFVRSGEGELIVNGRKYPISEGCCGLFYYYDFHRFVPGKGQTLNVIQSFFSYETFLFASVYPSNELISLQSSTTPIVIRADDPEERNRLAHLFETLEQSEKTLPLRTKCAMLFEILGRMSANWQP